MGGIDGGWVCVSGWMCEWVVGEEGGGGGGGEGEMEGEVEDAFKPLDIFHFHERSM